MSLPENRASTVAVASALLPPDDAVRADLLVDYELGGVAFEDPSQGLKVRAWRAWVESGMVVIAPHPEAAPVTTLFSAAGVTELSLAFDQSMHATVAFVQSGMTKLYWYDTLAAAQVTTSYPGASSPMLCLDDKRAFRVLAGAADVLFFYLAGGELRYRQQRDRFGVERVLATLPPGVGSIIGCGMGTNGRVQVVMPQSPALHASLAADELFVLDVDGGIRPLAGGSTDTGQWLSRVYVLDEQPSFAWARVDAAAYPVTLTVFGGEESFPQVVLSDEPVRLPAVRSREWQIDVRGSVRVLSVRLASSREELEADDASYL